MTAYVNDEQKKEGAYGKAVKATLAATLAVGMVPAVAVADEANADQTEANDVETLALSNQEAWNGGTFTVVDNAGSEVKIEKNFAGTHYVATEAFADDGMLHQLKPVKVALAQNAGDLDLTDKEMFTVTYHKDSADGTEATEADMKKAGKFFMVVEPTNANTAYKGCKFVVEYSIAAQVTSLDGAELYQVADDDKDLTDKEFVYTGAAFAAGSAKGNLNVVVNGKALDESNDYNIAFYARNNNTSPVTVKEAGKYTAVITGTGSYSGTKSVDFEIQQVDLAKATFAFTTADFANPVLTSVNGATAFDGVAVADLFKVDVVKPASGVQGEYKYTVSLKDITVPESTGSNDDAIANAKKAIEVQKNFVKGSVGTYTAINATEQLQAKDVFYNGKAVDTVNGYTIEAGEAAFNLDKISVKHNNQVLDTKYYTVEVLDKKGNVVDKSKIAETGDWKVRVTANAQESGWQLGGSIQFDVKVKSAQVASKDVVWKLDGSLITVGKNVTKKVTYDGTDVLEKLDVAVNFDGKKLVEGTDYKMTVTNEKGEEVEKAVEKGKYKVVLTSDTYKFEGEEELTIEVEALTTQTYRIAPASLLHGEETSTEIAYTGEAIAPVVQYNTGKKDADNKDIWKDLPAGSYTLKFEYAKKTNDTGDQLVEGKTVEAMKELGFYNVTVVDANLKDSINVNQADAGIYEVVEGKVFSDVPAGEWYYDYVYAAEKAEYMQGIGNSDIFAPNKATTRAEAVQVLSRMANNTKEEGFTNPFSDIVYEGNLADPWYSAAVLWANNAGIVNGYPGTTEFRPNAQVTRAEFCIMMQNYAAATGQGVALEAGEADELLAGYADVDAVESWNKDAIAWAVKNKIFGGDTVLRPGDTISRAEMAKMTTEFQEKKLQAHKN